MASYSTYNNYANQMQYNYNPYSYSSYYHAPYGMMSGGWYYPDGKNKTESGEESESKKKTFFDTLMEMVKGVFGKAVDSVNIQGPTISLPGA